MALGHLRIDPWEWARWTLREFDLAYQGWAKINVQDRWEQIRALSFYTLICHDTKGNLKRWEDVFRLSHDKKIKRKNLSTIRAMTDEEKIEFQQILKNSIPLNG